MTKEKTHWLQNPNKNYLGHWDLPNGEDVILTISSAQWEEVKNPIINTSEAKRVIRFVEKNNWIKPFICNEVNANAILKSTGEKFMEDCIGKRVKIGIGQTKVKKEEVDCLRVRNVPQSQLIGKKIDESQLIILNNLLDLAGKDKKEFCEALKIESVADLPVSKFEGCCNRLKQMIAQV